MAGVAHIFNIIIRDKPRALFSRARSQKSRASSLELNLASFKHCYPAANHVVYDDEQIREVISNHFEKAVLDAYETLVPFAYKADLARYCILYLHGGVYSDISHLHINPIEVSENTNMVFFRDIGLIHPIWSVSNGVIYAQPRQELFYRLITQIVEHVRLRYYGQNPLDPTGPYLLGKMLTQSGEMDDIVFGDSAAFLVGGDPSASKKHIAKFMPDGELIAYRNKRLDSGIDEFVEGGNSYAGLWSERQIYRT